MSDKSIAQKLGIKPGARVWLSDASHAEHIGPLPAAAAYVGELGAASVGLLFAPDGASLRQSLAAHGDRLARLDLVWVAYPKGGRADINRDSLWPILAEVDMRPVSQIAIDDVWSALRFRPNRPGEDPFTGGR
jgi:hypothetical protein